MLSPKNAKGMNVFDCPTPKDRPSELRPRSHLSRKQTPLTNDPSKSSRQKLADSSLVDAEYRADKNFSKIVSPSAFNYFATICLWYHGALAAEHREGKRDELKRERLALEYG
ncbi:hypothetical protein RUM44_000162 [Polyplax serrata]|uniref:Uncharacterized protein n=1 Tax=Polyplax serrata TaxID=468196 RepID=A0ABR1B4N0_POLSC